MRRFRPRRPSPAMVVALLALFVALGGTGYAALKLPKDSVGTKQLRKGAVTSPKIKNNSVTGADIKESKLGPVPLADQAFDSAKLGGLAPGAYARRGDLQPGPVHLVASGNGCSVPDVFCGSPPRWTNFDNGYAPVAYRKDPGGWVHLQGVTGVTGGGPLDFVLKLAPGYRPLDATHEFTAVECGGTQVTYVDIRKDGYVQVGGNCLTLDGITFHP